MEVQRNKLILDTIEQLPFVSIIKEFTLLEPFLSGRVSIHFESLNHPLEFDVVIYPQYPFKTYDSETIKFINKDYLPYNHVMEDGVICIHTSHCIDLREKLIIDFHSLKNWIIKYYIDKEKDQHYEHIIVPQYTFKDNQFTFMFTDVNYGFKQHQYGFVNLKPISDGLINSQTIINFLTKNFTNPQGKELTSCKWSSIYQNIPKDYHGIYIFVDQIPAKHNKFIFKNWEDFTYIFKQDFLEFLHRCEKKYKNKKRNGQLIPLYVGYKISDVEIHWQVALLEIGKFPIEGIKKHQKWSTVLIKEQITWGISRNSSYKYFFGRGAFSENLVNKKILIIGTGAIGSIIARTLTKGGCTKIDLCDYDIKEPENVCRSEFQFATGITDKVEELSNILSHISPFIEVGSVNQLCFERIAKALYKDHESQQELGEFLNSYDLIFDCSTDNDLMYILNQLELTCDVINMSITNKAQELVCAFYPNIYDFVTKQFSELLDHDSEDLYNPTGCWSPTFKASYNDINLLVQYALKHINQLYRDNLSKNNFVIETGTEQEYKLELKQF